MIDEYEQGQKDMLALIKDAYYKADKETFERLLEIFTDPGDVVIDPCAGSGSTLRAAAELNRSAYGFEVERKMCETAKQKMLGHAEILLV